MRDVPIYRHKGTSDKLTKGLNTAIAQSPSLGYGFESANFKLFMSTRLDILLKT